MEADWEFEIGPSTPVIDAQWAGFVDLAMHPERSTDLPEAAGLPQLAETLTRLNKPESRVRTSKCDAWQVDLGEQELDPDELDAPPGTIASAWACYIDLLAGQRQRWENPSSVEQDCIALRAQLQLVTLRCCRADMVIRRAVLAESEAALGVTAYVMAVGPSEEAAKVVLGQALHALADSVLAAWSW